MMIWAILFALLIAPAIANPIAEPQRGGNRINPCNQPLNCLYNYGGEPFVTSYCSTNRRTATETTTVTSYSRTRYAISATTTVTGSAVVTTDTETDVVTIFDPTTTVSTEYTGTITVTNFVETVTSIATITSTALTCDGTPRPPSVTPAPMPTPVGKLAKRQDMTGITVDPTKNTESSSGTSTATAAPEFTCASDYGSEGLKSACRCARVPRYTVTRTITRDRTTIRTSTVTTIPTSVQTTKTTLTTSIPTSVTATGISTVTEDATSRTASTTTLTLTTREPNPTAFQLTYTDAQNNLQYGSRTRSPGSEGELIAFGPDAAGSNTTFSLDAENQLTQQSDGRELLASKNARDPFPFLFLGESGSAPAGLTPYCSACNGTVACEFPGAQGSRFYLCDGFLALGRVPDGPDCVAVTLGYRV
ncbi:hypothetical protein Q7P37_005692 [Cladosporium fusiforme]